MDANEASQLANKVDLISLEMDDIYEKIKKKAEKGLKCLLIDGTIYAKNKLKLIEQGYKVDVFIDDGEFGFGDDETAIYWK